MYPLITLETYSQMVMKDGTENPFYDEELIEFTVPYSWLSRIVSKELGKNKLEEYLDTYTWDETWSLYEEATADKVIVKERIVER